MRSGVMKWKLVCFAFPHEELPRDTQKIGCRLRAELLHQWNQRNRFTLLHFFHNLHQDIVHGGWQVDPRPVRADQSRRPFVPKAPIQLRGLLDLLLIPWRDLNRCGCHVHMFPSWIDTGTRHSWEITLLSRSCVPAHRREPFLEVFAEASAQAQFRAIFEHNVVLAVGIQLKGSDPVDFDDCGAMYSAE